MPEREATCQGLGSRKAHESTKKGGDMRGRVVTALFTLAVFFGVSVHAERLVARVREEKPQGVKES